MTASVTSPGVSRSRLWFGLLGGAIAWFIHLVAASFIAEWGCVSGLHERELLGFTVITWSLIAVSVFMIVVSLASAWSAYWVNHHYHKVTSQEQDDWAADIHGTDIYMAQVGVWSSAMFVFIIAAQCVPIFFFLRGC
jgi:hypothetical protein